MDKYGELLRWMEESKFSVHDGIEIRESPYGGVGVFAKHDIDEDEILLRIPKAFVLSPFTCGIANLLDEADITGMMGLTLSYMFERCQGIESPWYAFLSTIEEVKTGDAERLPRFWSKDLRALLKGTELEFMGGLDEEEITETYASIIAPFTESYKYLFASKPQYLTYTGYRNALIEVCSRAFEVDGFRGLSLVPGACLFNHSDSETVHFVTDAEVCAMCGNGDYCEHAAYQDMALARLQMNGSGENEDDYEDVDDDDETNDHDMDAPMDTLVEPEDEEANGQDSDNDDNESVDSSSSQAEADSCDILTVEPVKADCEIFNSYGDYSNGVLLARYGFAIWDNKHETVGVGKEVLRYAKANDLKPRLKWWGSHFYRCVFGIDPEDWDEYSDEHPDEAPPSPDSITWKETLEVLSSGMPSPGLIMLANLLNLAPSKFKLLQMQAQRGKYSALPSGSEGTKVIRALVSQRAQRYKDGEKSSADYTSLALTAESPEKKLIYTVLGTEKLVIERCLQGFC